MPLSTHPNFCLIPHTMHRHSDASRTLARIAWLADQLDTVFRIPGTNIRFGFDSIIGIVPVVGDTATLLIGLYPVMEASRLGVRKRVIGRMLANLGVDWLIGLIPLVDLVFDVAYKANIRNLRLLEAELGGRPRR